MKNFSSAFNQDRGNFRRREFGGGNSRRAGSGDRNRERPQMHEAICSDCGKKCEVPFKPTGEKPIYCSQCFSKRREETTPNRYDNRSDRSDRSERRSFDRPRREDKRMFDATCDKCGARFELPFRPNGSKPVYCNECFGGGDGSSKRSDSNAGNQYKEQLDMLNTKLDRILRALDLDVSVKKEERAVPQKKETIEKKEIVKKEKKVAEKKEVVKKEKKVAKKKASKKDKKK